MRQPLPRLLLAFLGHLGPVGVHSAQGRQLRQHQKSLVRDFGPEQAEFPERVQ